MGLFHGVDDHRDLLIAGGYIGRSDGNGCLSRAAGISLKVADRQEHRRGRGALRRPQDNPGL